MPELDPNKYFYNKSYNIDWSASYINNENDQPDGYPDGYPESTWITLVWIPTTCATCGNPCVYFGDRDNPEPQITNCSKCEQYYGLFENFKW